MDSPTLTAAIDQSRFTDKLRHQIRAGDFPVGSKLPSQRAIAEYFGVSRSTVQLALGHLRDEGMVRSEQGRGVFVVSRYSDPSTLDQFHARDGMVPLSDGELEPEESDLIEFQSSNRAYELLGRFFVAMRGNFDDVKWIDSWVNPRNKAIVEWSRGATIPEVLYHVVPTRHTPTGELVGGVAGLRLLESGPATANLTWLPVEGSSLLLRRLET